MPEWASFCLLKSFPLCCHIWGHIGISHRLLEQPIKNEFSIEQYYDNIVEYLISAQDFIMETLDHTFLPTDTKLLILIFDTPTIGSTEVTLEGTPSTDHIVDIFLPDKEYGHISMDLFLIVKFIFQLTFCKYVCVFLIFSSAYDIEV